MNWNSCVFVSWMLYFQLCKLHNKQSFLEILWWTCWQDIWEVLASAVVSSALKGSKYIPWSVLEKFIMEFSLHGKWTFTKLGSCLLALKVIYYMERDWHDINYWSVIPFFVKTSCIYCHHLISVIMKLYWLLYHLYTSLKQYFGIERWLRITIILSCKRYDS